MMIIPRYREKSSSVKKLQRALNKSGFSLKVDGDFGPKTKRAVSKFQKEMGLDGSGIIGPKTMRFLGLNKLEKPFSGKLKTVCHNMLYGLSKELGVKEGRGKKNNPRVVWYFTWANLKNNLKMPDSVPWCAALICMLCEYYAKVMSHNSLSAREFEKHGWRKLKKGEFVPGCVVTMWRGKKKGWQGHIGIALKRNSKRTLFGGGNQNDEVNLTWYSNARITGCWVHPQQPTDAKTIKSLEKMAQAIIDGKKISKAGKVT